VYNTKKENIHTLAAETNSVYDKAIRKLTMLQMKDAALKYELFKHNKNDEEEIIVDEDDPVLFDDDEFDEDIFGENEVEIDRRDILSNDEMEPFVLRNIENMSISSSIRNQTNIGFGNNIYFNYNYNNNSYEIYELSKNEHHIIEFIIESRDTFEIIDHKYIVFESNQIPQLNFVNLDNRMNIIY
jgi:hypothetical protein